MDMLAFLYIASLFAIGGAAFSLMWRNISDIKKETTRRYGTRTHPEAPKDGEEILYVGLKPVESPDLYQSLRERIDEIEDEDDDGDIVVRR